MPEVAAFDGAGRSAVTTTRRESTAVRAARDARDTAHAAESAAHASMVEAEHLPPLWRLRRERFRAAQRITADAEAALREATETRSRREVRAVLMGEAERPVLQSAG